MKQATFGMRGQLALNLRLRDASSLENFQVGENREAFERLRALLEQPIRSRPVSSWLYLWGEPGCGKTHLLEAACRAAQESGVSPVYLPLAMHAELDTAMLEDAEQGMLVCIDDMHVIAGDIVWERALFGLYERLRAQGGALVIAARNSPASLPIGLADLASRLSAGLVYQLRPPGDDDKIVALRLRASRRGFELTEDVARYLLARYPRDTHSLFALLDRLDDASLAAQRRLTIPFLRTLQ